MFCAINRFVANRRGQAREADLVHVQRRATDMNKQLEAARRDVARARHAAADAEQRSSRLTAELRRANELVRHAIAILLCTHFDAYCTKEYSA